MFKARLVSLVPDKHKTLVSNPYIDKVKRKLKRYKMPFEESLDFEDGKLIIVLTAN